ncbi:MAG: pirin family protein [Legionellaceae bacterium]|nr:pirin family protein [Legionellaceae bacterium]
MKKILLTRTNDSLHWVGDGFPVRTLFSYAELAKELSPFLLLDYAGPVPFPPSTHRRGVGAHPHRGFETVTLVYSGEVEHRDSSGAGGLIQSGDVQWMTAASGLVHEEYHGPNFTREGGLFEVIQLWVNLPQKEKMSKPRYQSIRTTDIPLVTLANHAGTIRVIAGEYGGTPGPATSFTPLNLWDIRLQARHQTTYTVPEGHTAALFVLSGEVLLNDEKTLGHAELAVLERDGDTFSLQAQENTTLLFLGGEPIDEPLVGQGPFVMNTSREIQQAFLDYRQGKMGSFNE